MSTHEYRLIASSKSPDELVSHDRVDVSLYNDPALFEAELEKIFYRTWVWVAHESDCLLYTSDAADLAANPQRSSRW